MTCAASSVEACSRRSPLVSSRASRPRTRARRCPSPRRWLAAPLAATIDEAPRFKLQRVEALDEDVCIVANDAESAEDEQTWPRRASRSLRLCSTGGWGVT